jgi:predicted ABC-class ATPase
MSGRGAYYKNKYGGRGGGRGGRGGRGRGRSSHGRGRFGDGDGDTAHRSLAPGSLADLQALLYSIDGRPYPAYHDLERQEWQGDSFVLRMGRAQADPFAPPTRCQIRIPAAHFVDAWPAKIVANNSSRVARVAAADHVLRHLYKACRASGADQSLGQDGGGGWSGPKGGACTILAPTQHVLEQSAVQISCDADRSVRVILQLTISLPARGRSILGQAAQEILCQILPQLVSTICRLSTEPLWQHVHCVEDQVWLRDQLSSLDLVAFVPNGAILPRRSGVDDRPLAEGATPFESPSRWERSFELPRTQTIITGMAIPQGVTLICGGGFHGKSTLLQALQWAIYPKLAGDGREFCVVRPQATTVRAEDGRAVQAVNISDFLRDLPGGHKDTACFSTDNASGSTSQASSIAEVRT